jgi:hypothetical protein
MDIIIGIKIRGTIIKVQIKKEHDIGPMEMGKG